jgi:hypothetical protein
VRESEMSEIRYLDKSIPVDEFIDAVVEHINFKAEKHGVPISDDYIFVIREGILEQLANMEF